MRNSIYSAPIISKGEIKDANWSLPYFEVEYGGKKLRYSNAGRLSEKRVRSLDCKEPVTLPWLEHFRSDHLLIDIGANVGMYSVYASKFTGCKVLSVEPEALNYAELNKNIQLNHLDDRVTAYCCAMTDRSAISKLHLNNFAPGWSHHDFDANSRLERGRPEDAKAWVTRRKQGCVGVTLDDLFSETGGHNKEVHIKIDVDGFEEKVVEGGWHTINDSLTRTVLIETDFSLPASFRIMEKMRNHGWKMSIHQMCTFRDSVMSEEELERMMDRKEGGTNIIYFKEDDYYARFENFSKAWKDMLGGKK